MKRALLATIDILSIKNLPSPNTYYFLNFFTIIKILLVTGMLFFCIQVFAQPGSSMQEDAGYRKAITERSEKIVNALGLTDSGIYNDVKDQVINQYSQLNAIDEQNKATVTAIKNNQSLSQSDRDESIKKETEKRALTVKKLHDEFIAQLQKHLSDQQVEKVKDGMTYNICPITYAAYQDMLPGLTTGQKEKIHEWLKEARELAIDEGSSEKKHAVFGKYKGRINNYLSAAGYDMKKEGEEWQKRIKERDAARKDVRE